MRIGPWSITRQKRDPLGRPLFPWEVVTLDQLSDEARTVITKMARVSAQDFYEEMREEWLEYLRNDLDTRIAAALRKNQAKSQDRAAGVSYMDGRGLDALPRHEFVIAQTVQGKSALAAAAIAPEGGCFICERPYKPGEGWQLLQTDPSQWMHLDEPGCIVTPIKKKDAP